MVGVHPAAIVWIVLFSSATLLGCTALMIRFWLKLLTLQRETFLVQPQQPAQVDRQQSAPQLPPRLEAVPSVTENTTRTFAPIYHEPSDRGSKIEVGNRQTFLYAMQPPNRPVRIVVLSFVIIGLIGNWQSLAAQSGSTRRAQTSPATTRSRVIANIVRQIDARNIERTIRQLVSFGTRNTLSEQDDPKRGIGAARDWLYEKFRKVAETSNGRMTVEKQSFEQQKAARVPQPTMLTNIVATLKGTQPESSDRLYVVSGHYDSMCNSPTDAKCDAPGGNDDASGTAAVLEMARVMAPHQFDATIIFMTVPGEEQGLLGSTYFAEQAKQESWNIEGMFTNDIIGNTLGGNGVRDRGTLRVFSEGVPSNETAAEANIRRSVGGENDAPSRQLARFIKEAGEHYVPGMKVTLVYRRDRYGRGGDHMPFVERGYAAVRFTEPNEDYRHQHQNVRLENGVQDATCRSLLILAISPTSRV